MEEVLKLENQLCFPLYVCSKEVIRRYKPFLEEINLTYTQYIVMLVLWENDHVNVKQLGEKLYLDSGTLTPLLKKLEQKNYIQKTKYEKDERNQIIEITKEGKALKEKASKIPEKMGKCLSIKEKDANILYEVLYRILKDMNEKDTSTID